MKSAKQVSTLTFKLLMFGPDEKKHTIWKVKGFQMDQLLICFIIWSYKRSCSVQMGGQKKKLKKTQKHGAREKLTSASVLV